MEYYEDDYAEIGSCYNPDPNDYYDFNKESNRDKWETWNLQKGYWICLECNSKLDDPHRAPPIHRASINCSECDAELTRRTSGGQHDSFNWVLRQERS